MKNILYILFAVFAVSCETILTDVPVPEVPTQAVVFANLSPLNNFSRIELTKSKPVINSSPSNEFDAIVDADVKVTVGATEYTFTYDAPNNAYFHSGNIPFASGDVCSFLASTAEYGDVKCSVEVPPAFGSYKLTLDSVEREYETEYALKLEVPNTPEKQYYRFEAFNNYGDDTFQVYSTKQYFSDEEITDGTISLSTKLYSWKAENGGDAELFGIVSSITEDHYNYGKALRDYEPNNPFAEPFPLPNNIEGGLGIFTVSNQLKIAIR